MVEYNYLEIINNPRVSFFEQQPNAVVTLAEDALGLTFPELIRSWIRDFGFLGIMANDYDYRCPRLDLFGIRNSEELYLGEDIIAFNQINSPAHIPPKYLVFAKESEMHSKLFYALRPSGGVVSLADLWLERDRGYRREDWQIAFGSLESFWENKVQKYLVGEI